MKVLIVNVCEYLTRAQAKDIFEKLSWLTSEKIDEIWFYAPNSGVNAELDKQQSRYLQVGFESLPGWLKGDHLNSFKLTNIKDEFADIKFDVIRYVYYGVNGFSTGNYSSHIKEIREKITKQNRTKDHVKSGPHIVVRSKNKDAYRFLGNRYLTGD